MKPQICFICRTEKDGNMGAFTYDPEQQGLVWLCNEHQNEPIARRDWWD